jgi:Fic family protein
MQKLESNRVGELVMQQSGYECFIPRKFGSSGPDIKIDMQCIKLLTEAERALAELKGITETIPNPDLFIAYYVKKEALLSSQIEGTQCSLDEVLQVDEKTSEVKPVQEVVNYINAMNTGLEKLAEIPVCLRLINNIHKILLSGVRGKDKNPGAYKKNQNFVGETRDISKASYIPPPPQMINDFMSDWEGYYQSQKEIPVLIEAAMLHSYFETIHAYEDGNGRIGRLLITFMLCERGILDKPLLYLSLFFKENKKEYYQLLMDVRFKGRWEEWIKFFLRGIKTTSLEAKTTANEIRALFKKDLELIKEKLIRYSMALPTFELICETPIVNVSPIAKKLGATYPTISQIFKYFMDLGILTVYAGETGRKRYVYSDYLKILKRGTE